MDLRRYFRGYAYRLEVAERHPYIVRVVAAIIINGVLFVPILLLSWPPPDWMVTTFAVESVLAVVAIVVVCMFQRRNA
jgi:hypothetical protein